MPAMFCTRRLGAGVNAAVVDDSLACTAVAAAPVASPPSASAISSAAALVDCPLAGGVVQDAGDVPVPPTLSAAESSSVPAAKLPSCRRPAASVAVVPGGTRELP